MLVYDFISEALLEGLVRGCRGGKVSGLEWLVEVVVDYGLHGKGGHVRKELRVEQ